MPDRLFRDRRDAGRVLAGLLDHYRDRDDVVVLALPRGGVPVGYEVAAALGAPLDAFSVRKLGVPGREELAMGAIASGGMLVLNDDVIRGLDISPETVQRAAEKEGRELLRREQAYREGRPAPDVTGKVVILVDDGLATGASMRAAVQALRQLGPARIVVAVPAAPESACREFAAMADEVVCATTPSPFFAVGASYWDFTQVTDEEVRDLLRAAATFRPARGNAAGPTEAAIIRAQATPVEEGVPSGDTLLDLVGDAQFVLIGEASHGTHDFYAARARITRRLIEEKGFAAVAVEADWPDAYRVNRYVRAHSDDMTAEEALRGFERFPTWMWRNAVVLDFVGWLREHNDDLGGDEAARAGFYGLDLYSLCRSMHRHALEYARRDGLLASDELFYAEQNARVVQTSAEYYRTMFSGRISSWNLRDRHMAATLDELTGHLTRQRGQPAKIVVWAHKKGFMLSSGHAPRAAQALRSARAERAIGVIYRPDTERQSHYFRARAADQFDAVIHIDETRAVEPLERTPRWERGEVPETYPFTV
jgi:predicted phosphoribosyltransferase/erythromycin esterase-like protein